MQLETDLISYFFCSLAPPESIALSRHVYFIVYTAYHEIILLLKREENLARLGHLIGGRVLYKTMIVCTVVPKIFASIKLCDTVRVQLSAAILYMNNYRD